MSDPMNDIVFSGIDSFLPIQQAQKQIFDKVDEILVEAVETQNPDKAFSAMNALLGISQISGLAFSKFIYVMAHNWKKFNQRDDFLSRMEDKLGKTKKTVNDHITIWSFLVEGEIPKEYLERFKTMPIRCLIPIANLWKQEFDVEDSDWARLSNAPDPTTINKIIREIKGVEPKKDSLQIEWEESEKHLIMWKSGKPHYVYLTYDEKDEVVLAGLARLFGDGRVLEK